MSTTLSLGVVFGGQSPEHDVSIATARSIIQHLDPQRFEVRPMGIARNGVWAVQGDPLVRLTAKECPERGPHPFLPLEKGAENLPLPDVFFNAIHGASGEDGQLQGYLEMLGRPYTGAGLLAMAAGMDKWITKRIWASEGLPVGPFIGLTEEQWRRDPEAIRLAVRSLGMPVFVKPANTGSSIGITKVKTEKALTAAVEEALTFDRRVLVEKALDAREIEIAVLGGDEPLVSVPGEVNAAGEFYDFDDKYQNGRSTTVVPAELPGDLAERLRAYARAAFRSLDTYGMARVDFFVERQSQRIYLNEINLIPGFTQISMYPKLMEASGVPYAELLNRLVDLALARHAQMRGKVRDFQSRTRWYA